MAVSVRCGTTALASGRSHKARAVVKVVNDAGVAVNNVSVTGDFSGAIDTYGVFPCNAASNVVTSATITR